MFNSRPIAYRLIALCLIVPLIASGCEIFGEESADDREARETAAAAAATSAAMSTQMAAAQQPAGEPSATGVGQVLGEGEIITFTPTATDTPAPTLTPSPTTTPTDPPTPTSTLTPTPDETEQASARCLAEIQALAQCVTEDVVLEIFPDGAPDHRIVNNMDPATLYRNPDVLAILNQDGVTLIHNNYTRPVNCPLTTPCVLHTLVIEFPAGDDAMEFFDLVTAPGTGLPGEVAVVPFMSDAWDISKCATGSRPSSAAGAPDFAVIYCSFSLGTIHVGWNLSAYESLQDEVVNDRRQIIEEQLHQRVQAWLDNQRIAP
jgi:hypothetical protein